MRMQREMGAHQWYHGAMADRLGMPWTLRELLSEHPWAEIVHQPQHLL